MRRNISRKDAKENAKTLSFPGDFASSLAPLREIFLACLSLVILAGLVSAQTKPDPNKFAVIIDGPGGEEAYTKQFDEWTSQLRSALSEKFGFEGKNVRVLSEAKAEDVKK